MCGAELPAGWGRRDEFRNRPLQGRARARTPSDFCMSEERCPHPAGSVRTRASPEDVPNWTSALADRTPGHHPFRGSVEGGGDEGDSLGRGVAAGRVRVIAAALAAFRSDGEVGAN